MKWIKTTEKLPPMLHEVLLFVPNRPWLPESKIFGRMIKIMRGGKVRKLWLLNVLDEIHLDLEDASHWALVMSPDETEEE